MKKLKIIIAVATFFCAACSNKNSDKNDAANNSAPINVKAFILKSDSIKKQISLPGEILPYEKVQIRSKVSGYVGKINVDIGSEVKKGQVLVIIEAPEIKSKSIEALGKKNSAESKFLSSKDSYERLLKASAIKGAISENDLQVAKNKFMADSSEFQAALSAYQSYKEMESYLTITAPFNGTITKRNADEGAYIGNPTDKPILEMENDNTLRLRVAVPEALVGIKLLDNKVQFTTRGIPDKKFTATLSRKAGSIDVATRSEVWEFEVNNENKIIKSGMFADVKLTVVREGKSLVVPFSAVLTTLEKKVVIRISNGKTEWIDISQGINLPDKTEIFGNINLGDTLVLKANEELKTDTKVIAKFE
ncbi:MAG: efflux RND transporter periplasmic adaptor subunit [Bacteroidia bacterium]